MNRKDQRVTLTCKQGLGLVNKRTCLWCGGNYYEGYKCKMCETTEPDMLGETEVSIFDVCRELDEVAQEVLAPQGGPSAYYDMPFKEWTTTNDMMEYLAEHKWGRYGIHLKDILKGICRWGDKQGTTIEYDARKIIYYGVRVLQLAVGRTEMRAYLREILHDPQFKAIEPESAPKRKYSE